MQISRSYQISALAVAKFEISHLNQPNTAAAKTSMDPKRMFSLRSTRDIELIVDVLLRAGHGVILIGRANRGMFHRASSPGALSWGRHVSGQGCQCLCKMLAVVWGSGTWDVL